MVKPQFEVGKDRVGKGGVVRDLGLRAEAVTAGELWRHIIKERFGAAIPDELNVIIEQGTLARRMLHAVGTTMDDPDEIDRSRLHRLGERLCDCLRDGRMLVR
jgi:hypothetical protein